MKRIFFGTIILISALCSFIGCKKDKVSTVSLFENKVWTGEFNMLNHAPEPYSLQCKEDGSFTWFQWGGSYPGTWLLQDKSLTLSFNSGVIIKAEVEDKALTHIQNNNANGWLLINGQYTPKADQSIDGTTWKEINNLGTLSFSSGMKINGTGIFVAMQDKLYLRNHADLIFPVSGDFYFGVVMGDGQTMRIINKTYPNYHPYILNRQ
jgi:hypothetical protein